MARSGQNLICLKAEDFRSASLLGVGVQDVEGVLRLSEGRGCAAAQLGRVVGGDSFEEGFGIC